MHNATAEFTEKARLDHQLTELRAEELVRNSVFMAENVVNERARVHVEEVKTELLQQARSATQFEVAQAKVELVETARIITQRVHDAVTAESEAELAEKTRIAEHYLRDIEAQATAAIRERDNTMTAQRENLQNQIVVLTRQKDEALNLAAQRQYEMQFEIHASAQREYEARNAYRYAKAGSIASLGRSKESDSY